MWSRLKKCILGHTGMLNFTAGVPCLPVFVLWGPVLLLFAASWAEEDSSQKRLLAEVVSAKPFLRWEGQAYRNYALKQFGNYPNHTTPYTDTPRSRYDFMGNFLMTGYDLYEWLELRTVGQKFGSSIFKDSNEGPWHSTFDYLVIGRDGYRDWGYNLIVGDAVIARFTPLTLSKVNFNGARFDLSMPRLQFTGLMSRIERPKDITRAVTDAFRRETHYADESTLLLGSRAQTHLGALTLGLNWVNQHVYRSAQAAGNSLKGRLKPGQPLMDWILVRFTDDSPTDGTGGAVVQDVQLVIDGEARPDLAPRVVRHRSNPTIRVGFASALGGFTPLNYRGFSASSGGTPAFNEVFYLEREVPFFSDYLFRLDHEAGIDVSNSADIDGLVSTFAVESPQEMLRADGEDELIFLFDMTGETSLQSVEVEALLGNDYQVDVAMLYVKSTGATAHHDRLSSTYYQTTLRSPGNVQDLSNLERVRFGVGENTANFVYSADLHLSLPGLEIAGEYARSSVYSRYPGRMGEDPAFDASPRFVDRGSAYFVNAAHRFGRGLVGAELFAINPGFQTEMRNYLNTASSLWLGHLDLALNNTMYWQLVEDNEDGDVYPDIRYGNAVGVPVDRVGTDLNGVWMGQDEDGDGTPDTNRNLNRTPDFEEPFLMFDVEPNAYAYGLDRNHNNEPDHREDDREVDYPYDHDERGFHLFSQWDLSPHMSFSMGRYDVEEMAGGGRNRVTYGLLGLPLAGVGPVAASVPGEQPPARAGRYPRRDHDLRSRRWAPGCLFRRPRSILHKRSRPRHGDPGLHQVPVRSGPALLSRQLRQRVLPGRARPSLAAAGGGAEIPDALQLAAGRPAQPGILPEREAAGLLDLGGSGAVQLELAPGAADLAIQADGPAPGGPGAGRAPAIGVPLDPHSAAGVPAFGAHDAAGRFAGDRFPALSAQGPRLEPAQLRAAHGIRDLDQPVALFRL